MTQPRITSDKVVHVIIIWDSDDDLSSDEEDAILQLSYFHFVCCKFNNSIIEGIQFNKQRKY